jgi:transposase
MQPAYRSRERFRIMPVKRLIAVVSPTPRSWQGRLIMRILALDLGKRKSVACVYESTAGESKYQTIPTDARSFHELIIELAPDRVVFEICPAAGWLADLVRALEIDLQVVNVAHDAWRWRNVRAKSDRLDALKLAQLSAMNQLSLVHVPERDVRQWRSLIAYRKRTVGRRTQIRNTIRAILDREGLAMPAGQKGWSAASTERLRELARPLAEVGLDDLWRGQLWLELQALEAVNVMLVELETKLDALAEADARCQRLMTIPGVGPRLAEAVAATLDRPERFRNGRQVGAYAGLTPRRYQSGQSDRQGRISHAGNTLLRSLLVEVAWIGLRYNAWMRQVYETVRRGSAARKKTAIIAVARRLLVACWAMLRDGTDWRAPAGVQVTA